MGTTEELIRAAVRAELQPLLRRLDQLSEQLASQRPRVTTEPDVVDQAWLTPVEAAQMLRLSPKTLANWRASGIGPAYRKVGRVVRYNRADVDAFKGRNPGCDGDVS